MEIQLNMVMLFCSDTEKLKNFYQTHFGFMLTEEIKNEWVVLKAGHTAIAFHKIGAAYQNSDESFKAESNTKLVFEINADLVAYREKLLTQGVLLKELKSFEGFNYLFCDGEDPEGNVFQLKQKIG